MIFKFEDSPVCFDAVTVDEYEVSTFKHSTLGYITNLPNGNHTATVGDKTSPECNTIGLAFKWLIGAYIGNRKDTTNA